MEILILAVGIIIGLMIPRMKNTTEAIKEYIEKQGNAQFLEPVDTKETFKQSKDIDEFLNKLK